MAYTRVKARALCNKTEFSLFENSLSTEIKSLSEKQLTQAIKRARELRNKHRDVYKRQTLALKKKGKAAGSAANIRTYEKAVLFDETLARYEKRAASLKDKATAQKAKIITKTRRAKIILPKTGKKKTHPEPQDGLPKLQRPLKSNATRKTLKDAEDNTTRNNFTSKQALYKNKKHQMEQALLTPIRGHISASVRRAQAKKDNGQQDHRTSS